MQLLLCVSSSVFVQWKCICFIGQMTIKLAKALEDTE